MRWVDVYNLFFNFYFSRACLIPPISNSQKVLKFKIPNLISLGCLVMKEGSQRVGQYLLMLEFFLNPHKKLEKVGLVLIFCDIILEWA